MISRSALTRGSQLALRRPNAAQRGFAAVASPKASYEPTDIAGVKVAARDDHGPVTRLAVIAKAGTRYEPLPGLTNTRKRSALRITRESELLGGQLSSYHTREALVLQANFLREDLPYFTELLAEVVSQTRYTTFEFNEEVEQLIHLKQKKLSAASIALDAAHSVAFHTGLGAPLYPTADTPVSSYLNEHSVAAFAEAAYTKPNIAVVADGASHAGLAKWIEPFFKDVPVSSQGQLNTAPAKYFGGEQRIAKTGGNSYVVAFPGASLKDPKPETAVLVGLLGGASSIKWAPGFTLLSKATAAAPGAVAQATNFAYSDAGLFTIQVNGSAGAVRKATEEAVKSLKAVVEGNVAKEDLVKAIAKAKFDLLSASETSGTGLVHAGANLIAGGSPLKVAETVKALESVTVDNLKAAAKALLEGKASVAAVGDLHVLPFAEELGLKLNYNRYLAVSARVVRRSLKDDLRLAAERRGQAELKFAKWTNGKQGETQNLAEANAAARVSSRSRCRSEVQLLGTTLNSHKAFFYTNILLYDQSTEGVVARDITSEFASAAAALKPGELVKDGFFTLFESVGGLEIMDSKMDSGFLAPGESLDEEYDVTRPLLPSEVVGIIDQLLCLEMAWHLGYPLSQTLLTNVYIEAMLMPDPADIHQADFIRNRPEGVPRDPMFAILRAYCLGLLKACYYVNEKIKSQHYYEEEDFVTNTYNRSLLENIDFYEIRDEIMEVRKMVNSMRNTLSREMLFALSFRLELRTYFLRAIELAEGPARGRPGSLSAPWSQMQHLWDQITKSRRLGTPVPEAFSTKIQRKLASTMPPRPIVQLSFEETSAHFKKLFADGVAVADVFNYTDPENLLNFVMTLQAEKPQPLVYIRSLLQDFLFKDVNILDQVSIRDIIDDDMDIITKPCWRIQHRANDLVEAPHDPRFQMARLMERFRHRTGPCYLDIFRAFCQNRCRVRRMLCHTIKEWEEIHKDAEEIDKLLEVQLRKLPVSLPDWINQPLSIWACFYKIRLMEWIVQLGFELEIYQPIEMAGMYWYLGHLAALRTGHVERSKFNIVSRVGHANQTGFFNVPGQEDKQVKFDRSVRWNTGACVDAAATRDLAEALSCLYTALCRLKLLVPPPRPYSSDALRYDIRMKPFATIFFPELPEYDEFKEKSTRPGMSLDDLLEAAGTYMAKAKTGYEEMSKYNGEQAFAMGCLKRWTAGVKGALKSAIAVGVAIAAVKRAVEAADGEGTEAATYVKGRLEVEVPKPDKGYHEWWIVPKIIEHEINP
ncbi:putative mak10 subunit [Naviculisporaceae sp. PSN 640]